MYEIYVETCGQSAQNQVNPATFGKVSVEMWQVYACWAVLFLIGFLEGLFLFFFFSFNVTAPGGTGGDTCWVMLAYAIGQTQTELASVADGKALRTADSLRKV